LGMTLHVVTTTVLESADRTTAVVCLISREYEDEGYWWTFHTRHKLALERVKTGYVALGCGTPDQLLVIPAPRWNAYIPSLNSNMRGGHLRWFVHIRRTGTDFLLQRKGGASPINITEFLLPAQQRPVD